MKLRLSRIDLLPEEARPAVQRAREQLDSYRYEQIAILEDLNASLRALNIEAISLSSFNRWQKKVRKPRS